MIASKPLTATAADEADKESEKGQLGVVGLKGAKEMAEMAKRSNLLFYLKFYSGSQEFKRIWEHLIYKYKLIWHLFTMDFIWIFLQVESSSAKTRGKELKNELTSPR